MWGAEMGVNDCGVVIGNEAVFGKLVDKKGAALLGMDLVRLGLERGANAKQALNCMTELLEAHGQGGPAGYRNKSFRYDNSFIIADHGEAWVLETAGRHWVAKQIGNYGAISNALSIEEDFDLCSSGLVEFARENKYFDGKGDFNFARAFDTRFKKHMSCAVQRRAASLSALDKISTTESLSFSSLASSLRQHAVNTAEFSQHDSRNICLHAGGLARPSQTCASMIVRLVKGEPPQIMMTGTSAPCLSLFQPVWFPGGEHEKQPIFADEDDDGKNSLWFQFERVHRQALFDKDFRCQLLEDRDRLENNLFAMMDSSTSPEHGALQAEQWHRQWHARAGALKINYRWHSRYDRFWRRLNRMDELE
jgi:dipeptidase